jgi:hypothetical protein
MHWWLMDDGFRASRAALGMTGPRPDAPQEEDAWWRSNAAIYVVSRLNTPLLMNLPESEAVFGLPLRTRLMDRHVPIETFIYPGAAHIKWQPTQIYHAQERAMAWLDFWLQGKDDPDPSDAGRAARWAALRATN